MRRALLAALLVCGLFGVARADPATIGFIITSAIVSAEVASTAVIGTITVAQIVGTVVIVGVSLGVAYALRPDTTPKPQDGQIITRQTVPPRRRGYGKLKVGGPLMLSETRTAAGTTRYQAIALHHGRIDSYESHWLSEMPVELDAGTGAVVDAYEEAAVTPMVHIFLHLGEDDQTAETYLTANVSDVWTSNHRGRGIAYAAVGTTQPADQENFTAVYPGGIPPAYRAVILASLCWDPRDEDQERDDPSTWTWTENPVLIDLDYHRHQDGMGLAFFIDGDGVVQHNANRDLALFSDAAIEEDWIPAADICDETVGGIERYICAGSYLLPENVPADVHTAIMATCDGQTYQRSDGAIGIRVGKTIAPTVTLTDTEVIGYANMRKAASPFLACNEVTAKYTSRDHDYQETDATAWRSEADITESGEVRTKPLALQWVPSHSQCRRLMKLAIHRFNPAWQCDHIVTNLGGLQALNERYIALNIEGGVITGTFEITSFSIMVGDSATTCVIGISSLPQSAFDWDEETEAGSPPPVPPKVMGSGT